MTGCCPIRRFALTTANYTPIITPIDCAYYVILSSTDPNEALLRSSDPNDSDAWHETFGYAFIAPSNSSSPRWEAGSTVTWLKAKTGTPTAIVEFIPG
jgi:hypothetical protein